MTDENKFKWDYRDAMDGITATDEEMAKAINMYEGNITNITENKRTGRHGMPKVAAALIAFACVLALSGGAVWAFTNSALKDRFFGNSEEEFEKVYTEVGTVFSMENMDAVYEGYIYDKSVDTVYLSFSFWDKEGNPIDISYKKNSPSPFKDLVIANAESRERIYKGGLNITLLRNTQAFDFAIGDDEVHIICMNSSNMSGKREKNNFFIRIDRSEYEGGYADKEFRFLLLNKEQFSSLKTELGKLDPEELLADTFDKENQRLVADFDHDSMQPEVVEILNGYSPCDVKCNGAPAQEILVDNLKVRVGRLDIALEYDESECKVNSFAIIREDGTRIEVVREIISHNDPFGNSANISYWKVIGLDDYSRFTGGGSNNNKDWVISFNTGCILGLNEKVKIEANGKIYE